MKSIAAFPLQSWFVGIPIIILGILLGACEALPPFILGSGTSVEREIVEDSVETGTVLFQDEFNDPQSGWSTVDDMGGQAGYYQGAYRIEVTRPEWYYWGTPGIPFQDVHVEAIISKESQDSISLYGIICRYQDEQNFYFSSITSDGYYSISKFVEGRESLVGADSMQSSPAIRQGQAVNYLRLDCVGDRMSLTVNGQPLFMISDLEFAEGGVGVIASLIEGDHDVIDFETVSIMKP